MPLHFRNILNDRFIMKERKSYSVFVVLDVCVFMYVCERLCVWVVLRASVNSRDPKCMCTKIVPRLLDTHVTYGQVNELMMIYIYIYIYIIIYIYIYIYIYTQVHQYICSIIVKNISSMKYTILTQSPVLSMYLF